MGYTLFDLAGTRLVEGDSPRVYHVVAFPNEATEQLSRVAWPDLAPPGL